MSKKRTKEEEFAIIYESCANDVYRACRYITMDDDLAQEMTQQAFVNFYERMDVLEVKCPKAYIIRSVRNLLYNYYRDTSKEIQPDYEEDKVQRIEPIAESVEEQYFEELKRSMIGKLTDEILVDLKENHKNWYEVIHMIFFLNMDHDEIAKNLDITKEVLYSRLHRAKVWIRKNYKKEFERVTERD